MKYCFYYDESEHSRVINLSTVTGETYYDGFLAAIIGWRSDHETAFEQRYHAFEEKHTDRKKKGELKSGTIKPKQLVHGFASLNKANVKLLGDFFSIFDENSYIYLFCASKIEYVISQIFKGYHNSVFFDMDAARYSIVKTIVTYRPTEVIESLYKSPAEFVTALKTFLTNRIRRNKENLKLKAQENTAFEAVLCILDDVDVPQSLAWDYHSQFVGFGNFLSSKGILDYSVLLDKEGKAGAESRTLVAARETGLKNCDEANSIDHFGIRIADMLVGIIGKLMKSLYYSLTPMQVSPRVVKTLLSKEWFRLTDEQLQLYKQLYHIMFEINKSEKFSEIIQSAMNRYLNGMLTNEEVIQELLKLAKDIAAAAAEGEKLGLTADELAFYDALTKPQAIKDFYEHDELIAITKELTDLLRKNRTIDWQKKESARAGMRRLVKRLLKKHKYPPEGMDDAVQTVMSQCEMWVDNP